MKQEYTKIFTPIRIGKVEIRNRFAMSGMATAQIDENWVCKQETIGNYSAIKIILKFSIHYFPWIFSSYINHYK